MIITLKKQPDLNEFKVLVEKTTDYLNKQAKLNEAYYLSRNAQKLEDDVLDALNKCAEGTAFENTIVKISGQKFPDLVVNNVYGVEVKSSKDDWFTLGGSVNESTRVEGVKNVLLIFGKLKSPVEFKCRPYEECLSDVVVTHYPRYKINMDLLSGETIFDKMNITYDNLRSSDNPVKPVADYYRKNLKEGETLWWLGDLTGGDEAVKKATMSVKLWRTLTIEEKHGYFINALVYFPEIVSGCPKKYENLSLWLVSEYGIVSPSLRDTFSAGGQQDLTVGGATFKNVPKILCNIVKNASEIALKITLADEEELKQKWHVTTLNEDRLGQWIDIIIINYSNSYPQVKPLLNAVFKR